MNRPYVFINVAMTADGKIDTFERRGAAISSPQDKARVDQLRAECDAIMVGGKTLLEEDPRLTVKSEALRAERQKQGRSPNPVKVGIVTIADLPETSEFLNAGPADVVIFTTRQTSKDRIAFLRAHGAQIFAEDEAKIHLPTALVRLKELGINRLMVEGGARLNFELLQLGLVDEVMIYVAPLIFGGDTAPTLAGGLGLVRQAAISLKLTDAEFWDAGGVLLKYSVERST